MAWPPPTLPINRTNATPQLDTHAADHNALALAINDVSALLGPAPRVQIDSGMSTIAEHVMTGGGAVLTASAVAAAVNYATIIVLTGWVSVASDSSNVSGIWCQVWAGNAGNTPSPRGSNTASAAGGSYAMVPVVHRWSHEANRAVGFTVNASWAGGSAGTIYASSTVVWNRYKA